MMDFDQIVVKESPGLCRCCLSEGCYKDLGTEYAWMSDTEVYADMLLECFDISITQHNEGPNGPNRLICEVCITRLRDACNFKKQVMESEKKFIDMVGRGEFRPKVLIYQGQMKSEEQIDEVADEPEVEYLDDEMTFGDGDITKEEPGESSTYEDVTVSTLPVKGKRGRPRKNVAAANSEKKAKVAKTEEKPRTSKAVAKEKHSDASSNNKPSKVKISDELRKSVSHVLETSTIMPFKWFQNRYRCFFCDSMFADSSKLKQHTKEIHQDIKLKTVLKGIGTYSRIKWDISEISCKKCPKPILSLDEFIDHISDAHDLKFDKEVVGKYFYVFNLSDDRMRCVDCGEIFKFFTPLLRHVNKYHNKTRRYICDLCGLSFALKGTITSHIKNVHSSIPIQCKMCHQFLPTGHELTKHYELVHQVGKFKCPLCPKVLGSRYLKKSHLVLVHEINQFPCDLCPKIYTDKSKLIRHRSRVHLKEKTATCHICGYEAFDTPTLTRHIVSHDTGQSFQCDVCNKIFKRKKSLCVHKKKHVLSKC